MNLEEAIREILPDYEERSCEEVDKAIQAVVLAQNDKKLRESYLVDYIEKKEREILKQTFESKVFERNEKITAMMNVYLLEEDILKHKRKVLKEFMN